MEPLQHDSTNSHDPGLVIPARLANTLARLESKIDALYDVAAPEPLVRPAPVWRMAPVESRSTLQEYWTILAGHKRLMCVCAFAGLAAGVLVSAVQKPLYQAKATLEVVGLNENFLGMGNLEPNAGSGYSSEVYLQTQGDILQSKFLIKRAAAKLQASGKSYPLVPSIGLGPLVRLNRRSEQDRAIAVDTLGDAAKNDLTVQTRRGTRLIDVSYRAPNPQLAADFVNALTASFIDHNLQLRSGSTQRTQAWLAQELAALKEKLETAESNLQTYARTNDLIIIENKGSTTEERLRQLQEELSRAQADRISKQSRAEMAKAGAEAGLADTVPGILEAGPLRDFQVKIVDLRRELAELNSAYVPTHYKVQRVQAQLSELETQYERERGNFIERTRKEYESAVRREGLVQSAYERQTKEVSSQAAKAVHYNLLKREVDTYRHLYDGALQRAREAGLASSLQASNARVVDFAEPARAPYKPNVPLNSAVGLLSTMFVVGVGLIIRERADHSLKTPGDIATHLNLPELGVIPSANAAGAPANGLVTRAHKFFAWGENDSFRSRLADQSPILAESFRATLASLLLSSRHRQAVQVILVTSPNPGEGKSTIAANLAVEVARAHRRVLLIDADVKRPRLHEHFNVSNSAGWSTALSKTDPLTEADLDGLIQETDVPGLSVLTSGPDETGSTRLLYSARSAELLAYCRRYYSTVLIDTPPMLGLSDARVIGRRADAVVLVCRSGKTTRETALAAKRRLEEDGTPILGVVLNDWTPGKTGAGYYDVRYTSTTASS